MVNPWRQTRDQIAALDWLAAQPEVDPSRLGVWGSSYSGGQAIVLGAVDDRVRAIVANVPFVGGFADERPVDERYEELRAALLDDSADGPAGATDEPVGPVVVVNEPGIEGQRVPAAAFGVGVVPRRGPASRRPLAEPGVAAAGVRIGSQLRSGRVPPAPARGCVVRRGNRG